MQADIPVEYYKVVALEGENLDEVRRNVFNIVESLTLELFSCFHVLVKGTSSSKFNLFAGISLICSAAQDEFSIHAYAIRSFKVISKYEGPSGIKEIPSFNNIFDAFDFVQPGMSLQVKKHLVPITAEEFYNLDDIE